jgi:hypothetical protein
MNGIVSLYFRNIQHIDTEIFKALTLLVASLNLKYTKCTLKSLFFNFNFSLVILDTNIEIYILLVLDFLAGYRKER